MNGDFYIMSSLDAFLGKSKLYITTIKGPGIERSTGEGHRTKSRSQYVTQTCINPKQINFVNAMRQEELRTSRLFGLRLDELGNALVISDPDNDKAYSDAIKAMRTRFDDAVDLLCSNWDQHIEDHCKAFPADAASIRSFAPSANEARRKATFKSVGFTLTKDQIDGAEDLESSLADSIPSQAFFEFRNQLVDSFSNYGTSGWAPDKFTQAVRQHLEAISKKAGNLSGFHPSLAALPKVIAGVLKDAPTKGLITGTPALAIRGLMDMLSKPTQVLKYGFSGKPATPRKPKASAIIEVPEAPTLIIPPSVSTRVTDGSPLDNW